MIEEAMQRIEALIDRLAMEAIEAIRMHAIDLRAEASAEQGKSYNRSRGQYLRHAKRRAR